MEKASMRRTEEGTSLGPRRGFAHTVCVSYVQGMNLPGGRIRGGVVLELALRARGGKPTGRSSVGRP